MKIETVKYSVKYMSEWKKLDNSHTGKDAVM